MIRPSQVMEIANARLSADTHVYVDIGNCMAWAIHYLRRDSPACWHVNLIFGCMGHALPAALGGCLGGPGPVVAIVGDAAFAMSAFELHTAVEEGLPLVVLVLNDSGHGMVEMGSEVQFGPGAVPSARFVHRIDAAAFATSVGARARRVDCADALESALLEALASAGPSLIDVWIDPTEVPPFGSRMRLLRKNFGEEAA
jgi:acetolactate synthase-1/2/3 large subunit